MTGQVLQFRACCDIITYAETFVRPGNFLFSGFNFIGYRANLTRFSSTQAWNANSRLAKVSATLVELGGSYLFFTRQKTKKPGITDRAFSSKWAAIAHKKEYTTVSGGGQLTNEAIMGKQMSFTKRLTVYQKTDGLCSYCGCSIPARGFRVDHVIPVAQGGPDDLWNLTPSCRSCNAKKGAKTPEEHRQLIVTRTVMALEDYAAWIDLMDTDDADQLRAVINRAISEIEKNPPRFYIET